MAKEFESPLKPFYRGKAELTESHPMHIAVTSRLNNSEVPEDYQGVYVDSSVARETKLSISKSNHISKLLLKMMFELKTSTFTLTRPAPERQLQPQLYSTNSYVEDSYT